MATNNKKTNRTRKCFHGGDNKDIVLEYAKQPILTAAYSYHSSYYDKAYKRFIEPSNVLTLSQGAYFSKLKLYKKTEYLEKENEFQDLNPAKCILHKGNILCVAPSPVNNKLQRIYREKPDFKEWFVYANAGLKFGHLNKTALGTDRNSIVIVCNEYCVAKAKANNGKEYEICQPKVLGERTMRGGNGSDSEEESDDDSEEEAELKRLQEEYAKVDQAELDRNIEIIRRDNERKKAAQEETAKLNAEAAEKKKKKEDEDEKKSEEAWDAEEEKYKPPKNVESVNLEKRIGLDAHTGPVNALAWNGKGTKLVSGSSDTTLRMWSYVVKNNIQPPSFEEYAKTDAARTWVENKIRNYRPKSHEGGIINHNWNEINDANINHHLFYGDESLEKIVKAKVLPEKGPERVARDAYNTWLALSQKKFDNELKTAWEREEWKCDWISKQETSHGFPRYHVGPILSVAWSPDDTYIASGSEDGSIILWKPEEGTFYQKLQRDKDLEAHTGPVRSLVWSYDSKTLYSGSEDGTVKVWKHEGHSFKLQHTLGESNTTKHAKFLCVNVNEKYIVAGTEDGFIYVWDVNNYKLLTVLKKHSESITGLFWKDPRDPEKIVNPPIDPDTKKPYDNPIPLLVKDPETFISTSLDKTIKIIHLEPHMKKIAERQVRNKKSLTKKFMGEVVPMVLGRPAIGTDPGGLHYRQKVEEMDDELLESLQSNPVRGEIHEKTVRLNAIKDELYKTEGEDEEFIEKLKDDEKKLEAEINTLQKTLKPLLKPKVEGGSKNKKAKVTKKHRAKRSMNTRRRK